MGKIALLFFCLFLFTQPSYAFNSDLPNNKFGIHLAVPDREDLIKAAELVNSSGGKWGYVTLVIQENDRDKKKWQAVFDQLRTLKLIPIIRLATQPQGSNWEAPSVDDIGGWIDFLQSLNWVVKDRYVVLFNEPNHATEWGGQVEAEEYAKISFEFAKKLKEKDKDYFIMLAGFDASAPSSYPNFEDEETFLKKMFKSEIRNSNSEANSNFKNCLEFSVSCFELLIDGWSSHSYPNPGFNGSPYDRGRGSISTYDWELSYLKSLGIQNDLPVFITETGWPRNRLDSFSVGENLSISYKNIWNLDDRVRAVTPFVLNYQTDPFLNFSWKIQNSSDYYDQYEIYKKLDKVNGDPEQKIITSLNHELPTELSVDSDYSFTVNLQNNGQSILDSEDGYKLEISKGNKLIKKFSFLNLNEIHPNESKDVNVFINTGSALGQSKLEISLFRNNKKLNSKKWKLTLIPLPKLQFKIDLFPKLNNSASNIEIQIFDSNEKLVYKKSKLDARNGRGILSNIKNIYLGGKYRIVILVPYYLPSQKHIVFNNKTEKINFKYLLPLDFNLDGKFDFTDFWSLLKKPGLLNLFF